MPHVPEPCVPDAPAAGAARESAAANLPPPLPYRKGHDPVEVLTWFADNSLVTWVRESESLLGYTLFLAGHTIGLAFLVGPNLLIAARVLGLAPALSLRPLATFRPVMAVGLWLTVVTGLVLFATAPVGYVRNVVFLVKIAAIAAAVVCLWALMRELFHRAGHDAEQVSARARVLAVATLALWTVAVVAGRLTAYSVDAVLESAAAFLAVLLAAAAAGVGTHLVRHRGRARRSPTFAIGAQPTAVKGSK